MLAPGSKRMQRIDYAIDNVRKAMKAQEIERLTQQRARRVVGQFGMDRLHSWAESAPANR